MKKICQVNYDDIFYFTYKGESNNNIMHSRDTQFRSIDFFKEYELSEYKTEIIVEAMKACGKRFKAC